MLDPEQKAQDCCGCGACMQICPTGAITMLADEKGFSYPAVDEGVCIHCGRCRLVCPMERTKKPLRQKNQPEAAAARSCHLSDRLGSSSGGVFPVLARKILDEGGSVFGAAFTGSFSVAHGRAARRGEAEAFRGSKYVQSDMTGIWPMLGEDLKAGRWVLFSGTPCQIAAVRSFVSCSRLPEEKLLTCDNVCHGVPSPRIWQDYLEIVRKKAGPDARILRVSMRSKEASLTKTPLRIETSEGPADSITDRFSFRRLYSTGLVTRECCFGCPFARYEREGDLTLGDFWNARAAHLSIPTGEGISQILISTSKGKKLFDACRDQLQTQPVTLGDAWQPHLEYGVKKPGGYEDFWQQYLSAEDPEAVLGAAMKGTMLTRIIRLGMPWLIRSGFYKTAGSIYKKVLIRNRTEVRK